MRLWLPSGAGRTEYGRRETQTAHVSSRGEKRSVVRGESYPSTGAQETRLLLVDDDPTVLEALRLLLEQRWPIETAGSAAEARAILNEKEIALILADDRMPSESGVDLLAWASLHHPGAVRLLLTGYTDTQQIIRAINEGRVWHYVRKPCDNRELLNLIERALEFGPVASRW